MKKMIRPSVRNLIKRTVPLLLCLLLCSGCWDRVEINDVAFVLGSAVDRHEDGYRISVLIPLPGNMGGPSGGGGGGGKKPYMVQSAVGATPREALDNMQYLLSRRLFFAHRRVLLLSEEVLKEEGSLNLLDSMLRIAESRLTTLIGVTKGEAYEMLGADVKLERFPIEAIREILQSDATMRVSIKDAVDRMSSHGSEVMLPYLERVKTNIAGEETEEIRASGYVVMKSGTSVGLLKGDQAKAIRLLFNKFKPFSVMLNKNGGKLQVSINQATNKIKAYHEGDKIHFDINIYATGNIEEDLTNDSDIVGEIPELEQLLSGKLKSEIEQVLGTLQSEKSDFLFGQILERTFPNDWKYRWSSDWDQLFPTCEFHVSVISRIYRIGMIRDQLTIRES